jgi:hypothetical protein
MSWRRHQKKIFFGGQASCHRLSGRQLVDPGSVRAVALAAVEAPSTGGTARGLHKREKKKKVPAETTAAGLRRFVRKTKPFFGGFVLFFIFFNLCFIFNLYFLFCFGLFCFFGLHFPI